MAPHPRSSPIPVTLVFSALVPCLVAAASIAWWHGGLTCWVQGLYYLVATIPLALGVAGLQHGRRAGDKSALLRGAIFFGCSWGFFYHAWSRVEDHKADLRQHEAALVPMIAALNGYHAATASFPATLPNVPAPAATARGTVFPPPDYEALPTADSFRLSFRHNILRRHVYEPRTGWHDEASK